MHKHPEMSLRFGRVLPMLYMVCSNNQMGLEKQFLVASFNLSNRSETPTDL